MKRFIFALIVFVILTGSAFADTMITDFTAETSPDTADLLWLTVDVSTSAADRKITLGNLLLWMATQDWTMSGTWTGNIVGNASTATALASNPTDCSANQFANAIAASGALTCAALTDADVPNTITASNYLPLAGGDVTATVGFKGDGSTTKGNFRLYDLDNSAYVAITPDDTTTTWSMVLPAASPTGIARFDAGVVTASDTLTTVVYGGFTASLPICSDGSGNATTCTTQPMVGAIPTTTDTNGMSQAEMTSAGMYGRFYFATGAGTWNLPGAAAGMNICVYSTTAAAIIINPDDADDITLDGALGADGAAITSASGAGDFICLIAADATHWYTLGRSGTWTLP